MSKSRTFIAVAVSEEVRTSASNAINSLRSATDNVKWVAPENLHWTLQFLGNVDDTELNEVCLAVANVAAEHEAFPLCACGVNAFPSADRPRTLWLGATEGGEGLAKLQDEIEQSMADLGFHAERRRYVPHLTLGRVGRGAHGGSQLSQRMLELADYDGGEMIVDEVIVFASELGRDGPSYHVVSRAPLA